MRDCTAQRKSNFCHTVPEIPGFMKEHKLCLKTCFTDECNDETIVGKLFTLLHRILEPSEANAVGSN